MAGLAVPVYELPRSNLNPAFERGFFYLLIPRRPSAATCQGRMPIPDMDRISFPRPRLLRTQRHPQQTLAFAPNN